MPSDLDPSLQEQSLSTEAFNEFRSHIGDARLPPKEMIANEGEIVLMKAADGLAHLGDGPSVECSAPPRAIEQGELLNRRLWVVRPDAVVHAEEACAFGKSLPTGVIKHTNLTGGAAAFSGGELLMLDDVLVINGRSGRYGPRSSGEMSAVALAFARAGYCVWSMGYDDEADWPNPFIGVLPQCVTP